MINQIDKNWWFKINGLLRYIITYRLSVFSGSIIVNEYPRSGGTWLTSMLSELLELPFARNRLPYLKNQILHCHSLYTNMKKRKIILWRDGRDVAVSQYFHTLFYNDVKNHHLVDFTRKRVPFKDYENVIENLPDFIKYLNSSKGKPKYSWGDFVSIWYSDKNAIHVKYEDLVDNTALQLQKIVFELQKGNINTEKIANIVAQYALKNQKKTDSDLNSVDNSSKLVPFIRQGGYGGWRKYFSRSAAEEFNKLVGSGLIKLGYEQDDAWVSLIKD